MDATEITLVALAASLGVVTLLWLGSVPRRRRRRRRAEQLEQALEAAAARTSSLQRGELEAAWAARATSERLERTLVALDKAEHDRDLLSRDLGEARAALESTSQELAELRAAHDAAVSRAAGLDLDLQSARARIDQLEGAERQLREAEAERDRLVTRLDQLEVETADHEHEAMLAEAHRQLDQLRAELAAAGRPSASAARVSQLENDNQDLQIRLDAVMAARHAEQQTLTQRTAELEALKAGPTPAADSENDQAIRIAQLEAQLAELENARPDDDYADRERRTRRLVSEAVASSTERLRREVDHLRTVVAEKERIIRDTLGGQTAPPTRTEDAVLTDIKGIGPKIASILTSHGYDTITSIAELTDAEIDELGDLMPVYPGRIRDDDWVGQAKALLT